MDKIILDDEDRYDVFAWLDKLTFSKLNSQKEA